MAETTISFESKRIAVVTGGKKGIEYEISRQLAAHGVGVVLIARDVRRGTERDAARELPRSPYHLVKH